MSKPHSGCLGDLKISGLGFGPHRHFESRDPPRSSSPATVHPKAPRTVPLYPPPALNPWKKTFKGPPSSVRLREIRSRFLARKFFALWRRKTFGRTSPLIARQWRQKTLLRAAFSRWFTLYWNERKEWRLRLRAECHDRLRLWQKCFVAWKAFTLRRRVARAKNGLARAHACALLRRKVWDAWRAVAEQRGKQRSAILAFRAEWILRRCLSRWKVAAEFHRKLREGREVRMKSRAWERWREAVRERREEREKEASAEAWRCEKLKRKAIRALGDYAGRRRHGRIMQARADRFRAITLKGAAFSAWESRWRRALELHAFEGRIRELSIRCRLRWALGAIRRNVELVRESQVRLATAVIHDEKRKKRRAFAALQSFVKTRRRILEMKTEAQQHRRKSVLLRCIRCWQKRVEFEEEKRLEPQNTKAKKLRRFTLLRTTFSAWKMFLHQRQLAAQRSALANQHFSSHALSRCFRRWRVYVTISQRRDVFRNRATEFHRHRLLAASLTVWRRRCEEAAQNRYQFRVAVLHERSVLLGKSLSIWCERTQFVVWEREQLETAEQFNRSCLLSRYLLFWRRRAVDKRREEQLQKNAVQHYDRAVLQKFISAWRAWTRRKAKKRKKEDEASSWRARRTKETVMKAWRVLVKQRRDSRLEADRRGEAKDIAFLAQFWPKLRAGVRLTKQRRLDAKAADDHFKRVLLMKVLFAWRTQTALHSSERARQQNQLEAFRERTSRALAHRTFVIWRSAWLERTSERQNWAKAQRHHESCVRKRALAAWRAEVVHKQRVRLQEDQASWFDRVRLLGGVLRQWREHLSARHQQRNSEVVAVIHWARSLQKSCFVNWRVFVCARRIEKNRREEALSRYRARILQDGVRLWLLSSDIIRATRQQQSFCENLHVTARGLEAAKRCAERWRRKMQPSPQMPKRDAIVIPSAVKFVDPAKLKMAELQSSCPVNGKSLPQVGRPPPRVPDFLRESLQREDILTTCSSPEDELRDVCDRLKRLRQDRKTLRNLRNQLTTASGEEAISLKASICDVRAAIKSVDQNTLLERAKTLIRALSETT